MSQDSFSGLNTPADQWRGFDQCYNAQVSVDVETMLIVGQHLSQNPNDKQEISPALEELKALPESLRRADTLLADAGYCSEANVKTCEEEKILPYISAHRDKHNQSLKERFSEPPPSVSGSRCG